MSGFLSSEPMQLPHLSLSSLDLHGAPGCLSARAAQCPKAASLSSLHMTPCCLLARLHRSPQCFYARSVQAPPLHPYQTTQGSCSLSSPLHKAPCRVSARHTLQRVLHCLSTRLPTTPCCLSTSPAQELTLPVFQTATAPCAASLPHCAKLHAASLTGLHLGLMLHLWQTTQIPSMPLCQDCTRPHI